MKAPSARINNVLTRYGVDPGRNPRWVEVASAKETSRTRETAAVIRVG